MVKRARKDVDSGEVQQAQADCDAQRSKKRAWDRAAQRKLRDKTKARLEHLEQTIRALQSENKASTVSGLMVDIENLRAENERLRKIVANSIDALQHAIQTPPAPVLQETCHADSSDNRVSESERGSEQPEPIVEILDQDTPAYVQGFHEVVDDTALACLSTVRDDLFEPVDIFMRNGDQDDETPRPFCHDEASPKQDLLLPVCALVNVEPQMSASFRNPLEHSAANNFGFVHSFLPYGNASNAAWQMANSIFGGLAKVDVFDALVADTVDAGPLLKGIHLGWDSLAKSLERSPISLILGQMDRCLWFDMTKTNRAAIAYKSYMLIRYLLNPSHENLLGMPRWERPSTLQRTTRHPVAISFFPWPALRERLILNQEHYLTKCNFFARVQDDFEFRWPFTFEDMFIVEPDTGVYRATPEFIAHVRDLQNWSFHPRFFDHFPELAADVYA